jgi:hypothetical protein
MHRVEEGQPAVNGNDSALVLHMFLIARLRRDWHAER